MASRSLSNFLTKLIWLSVLPVVLLAIWLAYKNASEHQAEQRLKASQLAQNITSYIDNYLDMRIRAINVLADSAEAAAPSRHWELFELAQSFHYNFDSHVVLASADLPMQMLFNTRIAYGTVLPELPKPTGKAAAPLAVATRKTVVGDSFQGPLAHQLLIAIVAPVITNENKVDFLLISTIETNKFQRHLDAITIPGGWRIYLQDSEGNVLAQRNLDTAFASDKSYLPSYFKVYSEYADWSVVVDIPAAIYNKSFTDAVISLLLLILLATSVGVMGGLWSARRLGRQVIALGGSGTNEKPLDIAEINHVRALIAQKTTAIKESASEFRTLAETIPQMVWIARSDGSAYQFNQHWYDYTGLTLEQSSGDGWTSALHPDDEAQAVQEWHQALKNNETYEVKYRLRNRSGIYRWMLCRGLPLSTETGGTKWFGTCTDIHDLKRAEERLNEAQRLGQIGDWELDIATESISWSPQVYQLLGLNPEHGPPANLEENAKLFSAESRQLLAVTVKKVIESKLPREYEIYRHTGSEIQYFKAVAVPRIDARGEVYAIYGTIHDISAEKAAEELLTRKAMQQSLAAELGRVALAGSSLTNFLEQASRAITQGLNLPFSTVVLALNQFGKVIVKASAGWGTNGTAAISMAYDSLSQVNYILSSSQPVVTDNFKTETRFKPSHLLLAHNITSGVELIIPGSKGTIGFIGAYAQTSVTFSEDDIVFLRSLATTIGIAIERKRLDKKLSYMAQYDALTDLPNRLLLTDRLKVAFTQAARSEKKVAVLFLDLDRFKPVNEVFGHSVGDRVLKEVARRLNSAVRATDTVSRQGGDEFLIILPELDSALDARKVAEKILIMLAKPYLHNETEIVLHASIGIACYPQDGNTVETILMHADAAMYVAKAAGGDCYRYYLPEMNEQATERLTLESDLRKALGSSELFLCYQPQIDLASNKVMGLEALVRWQHPTRGLIPPDIFIPIAEDSGLIVPLGKWVLEEACRQHNKWLSEGLMTGTVAVNVSAHQFHQPNFLRIVEKALSASSLPASHLELELTERVIMRDADEVLIKLKSLHVLGVVLAIDDFGTGYSSLSYLQRFPLNRLKIDQSFTRNMMAKKENAAIVKGIISMAHGLNLETVAEGVETVEQHNYLRQLDCDATQGFLYERPMSVSDCTKYLRLSGKISSAKV